MTDQTKWLLADNSRKLKEVSAENIVENRLQECRVSKNQSQIYAKPWANMDGFNCLNPRNKSATVIQA